MVTTEERAPELYRRLAGVTLDQIPVSDLERSASRKEQAAAARALFKRLGLRGISVTAPSYSMARSVDVRMPHLGADAHDRTRWPHHHDHNCCGQPGGHSEETRCPACREEAEAEKRLEAILFVAFPNHRDRSDTVTDYFDYCWSVNH